MAGTSQLRAGRLDTSDFKQAVGGLHHRRDRGHHAATTPGIRYGLAANSFASVSLEPPLVLFCVDLRAASLEGLTPESGSGSTRASRSSVHRSRFGTVVAGTATG